MTPTHYNIWNKLIFLSFLRLSIQSIALNKTMNKLLACFKAYDIRGRIPDELNTDIAYRIGRAYAEKYNHNE